MQSCRVVFFASAAMFGVVAVVLLASPKGAKPEKPPFVSWGGATTSGICIIATLQQRLPSACGGSAGSLAHMGCASQIHTPMSSCIYNGRHNSGRHMPWPVQTQTPSSAATARMRWRCMQSIQCDLCAAMHTIRVQGYDQTIIPLVLIMAVLCIGILVGGVGMLVLYVLPPVYAKPLSYHVDILRKV